MHTTAPSDTPSARTSDDPTRHRTTPTHDEPTHDRPTPRTVNDDDDDDDDVLSGGGRAAAEEGYVKPSRKGMTKTLQVLLRALRDVNLPPPEMPPHGLKRPRLE